MFDVRSIPVSLEIAVMVSSSMGNILHAALFAESGLCR
jgi:hypothetical protein